MCKQLMIRHTLCIQIRSTRFEILTCEEGCGRTRGPVENVASHMRQAAVRLDCSPMRLANYNASQKKKNNENIMYTCMCVCVCVNGCMHVCCVVQEPLAAQAGIVWG